MDQLAREDIAASVAAHQELGAGFDAAIAEGLIERIGAEIDKRVDARLAAPGVRRKPDVAELGRRRAAWKGAVIGAAAASIPAIAISTRGYDITKGMTAAEISVVGICGIGYLVATWVHRRRQARQLRSARGRGTV